MVDAQQPTNIESRLTDSSKESPDLIQDQKDLERLNAIVRTVKGTNDHLSSLHATIIKQTILLEKQQKIENKKEYDKEFQDIKPAYDEERKAYDKRLEEKYKKESERHSTIHSISSSISLKSKALMRKVVSPIQSMAEKGLNGVNNRGWCDICSHISKGLRWFKNKAGGGIISVLVGSVKAIWKGITWVYSVGKKVITWMWDKFVMLAKIGWKVLSTVWDIVSTPVNFIWDIFKTVLMSFLTNPIGLVILGVGLFFAARYIINSIWPKAKDFFINLFVGAWQYLEKFVANIFTKGDVPALRTKVVDFFVDIKEWFFGKDGKGGVVQYIFSLYDEYIGKPTGFTTEFIFTAVVNFVSGVWENIKSFFSKIYSKNMIIEFKTVWMIIKELWNATRYVMASDEEQESGLVDPKYLAQKELLSGQNESRMPELFDRTAAAFIENKLLFDLGNKYLEYKQQNFAGNISEQLKSDGNELFKAYSDSIMKSTFGENTKSIFDKINKDESLNRVISVIVGKSIDQITATVQFAQEKEKPMLIAIDELVRARNMKDQTAVKEILDNVYDGLTNNFNNYIKRANQIVEKYSKKTREEVLNYFGKDRESLKILLDGVTSLDTNSKKYFNDISSMLTHMTYMDIKLYSTFFDKQGNLTDNDRNLIIEQLKLANKNWSDAEIQDMINALAGMNAIPKAEEGGVFKSSSLAIIGEGNVPEVVIPINKSGIEFALNATEVLIDRIYNDSAKSIDTSDKQEEVIVSQQRVRKAIAPKDKKLYDLKNIASSISTFG